MYVTSPYGIKVKLVSQNLKDTGNITTCNANNSF